MGMSSQHAIAACHRSMPSQHAITACHHSMSSQHVITTCHHIMSSQHVITACHHSMSSQHVIAACHRTHHHQHHHHHHRHQHHRHHHQHHHIILSPLCKLTATTTRPKVARDRPKTAPRSHQGGHETLKCLKTNFGFHTRILTGNLQKTPQK